MNGRVRPDDGSRLGGVELRSARLDKERGRRLGAGACDGVRSRGPRRLHDFALAKIPVYKDWKNRDASMRKHNTLIGSPVERT